MIRIAEEFLFFFDKEIIENYNVLPLAWSDDKLIVGSYNSNLGKIEKVLKELVPFEISMYKIKKEFFEEEYGKLFYKPEDIIVYDKRKLILPPGKLMIEEDSSEIEIIRYIIALMIRNKEKSVSLHQGTNNLKGERIFDFVYEKIKKFLTERNGYNPLPFLIKGRKLFLYYEINDDKSIYLELFPEILWEKEIRKLIKYYEPDKLTVIIGPNSVRKKIFLQFFIKTFKKNIFFTTRPLFKMPKINGFVFKPDLLDKYLYLINNKKYKIILFDADISLFTLFIKKMIKNTVVSLPMEDEKELSKKIKNERVEPAIKEAYDLNLIKIEFTGKSDEKISGLKPLLKKYKKNV